MCGIEELQKAYNFWKNKDYNKEKMIGVSFSSLDISPPYVFSGIAIINRYRNSAIFTKRKIDFIKSLRDIASKNIFPRKFIAMLESMKYEFNVKFIKEGTIFFANQPILFITGKPLVLLFFQDIIKKHIAKQIYIATSVARLTSELGKKQVVIQNSSANFDKSDCMSACIGGVNFCSDIDTGSILGLPIAHPLEGSDHYSLNISEKKCISKLSCVPFGKTVFLEGFIDKSVLDQCLFQNIAIGGIYLDIAFLLNKKMNCTFHYIRNKVMEESSFQLHRFSYRGLYVGDLLGGSPKKTENEEIFGYNSALLSYETLFQENLLLSIESIQTKKDRRLENIRKLPCKYRNTDKKYLYPSLICPNIQTQEMDETLPKINFA